MRTITIPEQTIVEAIQSYDHYIGIKVAVVVGVGSQTNGQFNFTIPQQFQNYVIMDRPEQEIDGQVKPAITDYTDLITQFPDGTFGTDDLWPYIDRIRARS